jgi:hypothetical protein
MDARKLTTLSLCFYSAFCAWLRALIRKPLSKLYAISTLNGPTPRQPKTLRRRSRFMPTMQLSCRRTNRLSRAKEAIRNLWNGLLTSPGVAMNWKTTKVEVSKSGDMAVLTGAYDMTMKDSAKDHGKYCEFWEKKAVGKWKCGAGMFSSDLPAAPATSPALGAAEKK